MMTLRLAAAPRRAAPRRLCALASAAGLLLSSRPYLARTMAAGATPFASLYGLPPGPHAVGVTTVEFASATRVDPGQPDRPRALPVEIWYPADATAAAGAPRNRFSDFIGPVDAAHRDEVMAAADAAFGGYREGLTVAELDASVWRNMAVRDAAPAAVDAAAPPFPLVVFSHGSGAYRASYVYWCEFLASSGYVVAACDHPGSARFCVLGGREAVRPGGPRSERPSMEAERPEDLGTVIDGMARLASTDPRFRGRLDADKVAVTGMSFGGWAAAAYLEKGDARVRAAVLQCPSLKSAGGRLLKHGERRDRGTPLLLMLGSEDTVIGEGGNEAARGYVDAHDKGPSYLLEVVRGGHVSFTSCEIYDPEYGNGIGATRECPSATRPGETYRPLDIVQQHGMINKYGLAFLDAYLKGSEEAKAYLEENHFAESGELLFRKGK